jgi:hypothetical protein
MIEKTQKSLILKQKLPDLIVRTLLKNMLVHKNNEYQQNFSEEYYIQFRK